LRPNLQNKPTDQTMEKSIKTVVLPYGIYLGLGLSLLTVLAYVFNLALFTKWWFGIIGLLILLIIAILAVNKAKPLYSAHFSFKVAFTAYFIPVLLGTLIATLVSILLFNIIDPIAAQVVTEKTVEATRQMMEKFGAPEADINAALTEMENENQFSALNQLKRFVFSLAFYSVIGLIVALIFKEKNPHNA